MFLIKNLLVFLTKFRSNGQNSVQEEQSDLGFEWLDLGPNCLLRLISGSFFVATSGGKERKYFFTRK